MKIYLVRHGEALSTEADPQRPLSSKGKKEVEELALHLKQRGVQVPEILHSPKLRAEQTAEIFGASLNAPLKVCASVLDSEASIEALMNMLPSLSDGTMVVGHMPMLSKLVSGMVLRDEHFFPITNYSPGTVICLETYDALRWIINWVLPPNLMA